MRCPSQNTRNEIDVVDNANYALYMPRRLILDIPNGYEFPWVASPEVERRDLLELIGPHNRGFFDHHGNFLLNGIFYDEHGNDRGRL